MQTRKVLFATDLSASSERAREVALQLAKAYGADLQVLHVIDPPTYPYPVPPPISIRPTAENALGDLVDELRRAGVRADGIVREGTPATEILRCATSGGIDLVVLGTHGHRGITHLLLGSVAEKVVRLSPIPVLTVPPWRFQDRAAAGRELATALVTLREEHPRVVALSREALPIALDAAKACEASLDILVVRPLEYEGRVVGAVAEDGAFLFDDAAARQLTLGDEARDRLVEDARQRIRDEVILLRGARWVGDMTGRLVIIVSDAAASPWPIATAAKMLRGLGARRILAAMPACVQTACEAMQVHVDDVLCIEQVLGTTALSLIYRDRADVTDAEAKKLLSPTWTPAPPPDIP